MVEVKFEVGKSYCPHRCSTDEGLHVITVTKRSAKIVYFTVQYHNLTLPMKARVKTQTYFDEKTQQTTSIERVLYSVTPSPFGCESCLAEDERAKVVAKFFKSLPKYGLTNAQIAECMQEWYGYSDN